MSVLGRFLVTKEQSDIASFKTPGLRNVLVTEPYFHDGSMETLWDVMDHYNKGDGITDPWLDKDMQPLALTESEIDDVVAFLASLTSPSRHQKSKERLFNHADAAACGVICVRSLRIRSTSCSTFPSQHLGNGLKQNASAAPKIENPKSVEDQRIPFAPAQFRGGS
jgi:hypothetical protein